MVVYPRYLAARPAVTASEAVVLKNVLRVAADDAPAHCRKLEGIATWLVEDATLLVQCRLCQHYC